MTGKIISQASLAQMQEFVSTPIPGQRYGLCLVQTQSRLNGRSILWHNGYVPSSVNDNAYDPESGVAIAVLTNQDKVKNFDIVLEALHKVTLQYE